MRHWSSNPRAVKERARVERMRVEQPDKYAEFRAKGRERLRAWNAANPQKRKQIQNAWKAKNKDKRIVWDRLARGLPEPTRPCPEKCELCGRPESRVRNTGTQYSLALDHCHETGKFRGWLCSQCNSALGMLGDTEEALLKALNYIRLHNYSNN